MSFSRESLHVYDSTLMETDEELKLSVEDMEEEEIRRKIPRCKVCNRQRFGHPGGISNFGQGHCKGLTMLEIDSEELKVEDRKINIQRKSKRGVKRDAPVSEITENPSAKKLKASETLYIKMMMDMQKQKLEMQMNMQMNMMKETKQMEIQAQMDLRKYEEEKRKEEREERAREREEEKQRYQEILSTLNKSRVPDRDFEREDKILNPPSWTKLKSFSAYKSNIQAWHKTYVTAKPFKKNQLLLESLKSNTDYEGLNQFIVNEIIENPEIKKESDIVDIILQKVEEFASESPWKINADLVRYFFNFEQEKDETSKKYILKFELLESKLRNHKVGISNMFLAC